MYSINLTCYFCCLICYKSKSHSRTDEISATTDVVWKYFVILSIKYTKNTGPDFYQYLLLSMFLNYICLYSTMTKYTNCQPFPFSQTRGIGLFVLVWKSTVLILCICKLKTLDFQGVASNHYVLSFLFSFAGMRDFLKFCFWIFTGSWFFKIADAIINSPDLKTFCYPHFLITLWVKKTRIELLLTCP